MGYNITTWNKRESTPEHSRVKQNREYLLTAGVANDFNAYLKFGVFPTFSDITDEGRRAKAYKAWLENPNDPNAQYGVGAAGAKSIFNKFGAIVIGGDSDYQDGIIKSTEIRLSHNAPLIDTPESRKAMNAISKNCTIKNLVEDSAKGILGRATFSYSDFMFCKHLGKMPNSYLIVLRRFPTPPDDYISNAGYRNTRESAEVASTNSLPMGELVAWMNTPGNALEDILKYNVKMPYEEKQAEWQSDGIDADSNQTLLSAITSTFDKTYRKQYSEGYSGQVINRYVEKLFPAAGKLLGDPPYHNLNGWQDRNKVYGPVDAIKKVYYRGNGGLDFDQSITVTFDYELRSYNGINGKTAMLDLISNILNVTYSTGDFWGGGYTAGGSHQSNLFANLNIMKASGGFSNFVDAFIKDTQTVGRQVAQSFGKINSAKDFLKSAWSFVNTGLGMFMGGILNKVGRPQKSQAASLLSPAATGLWHLTIGNPYHPIMSLGNMVLTDTSITHYGPLGLDDFPTGIKVTCTLTRGKPRDIRGIENMYLNGNDRNYVSMGPKIFDLFQEAKSYRTNKTEDTDIKPNTSTSYNKKSNTVTQSNTNTGGYRQRTDPSSEGIKEVDTGAAVDRAADVVSDKLMNFMDDIKNKDNTSNKSQKQNVTTKEQFNRMRDKIKQITEKLGVSMSSIKSFFGTDDVYAIYVAAAEQEYGSNKTNPKSES